MASQEVEVEQRVVAVVVIAAILLAVGLALGFGINKSRPKAKAAPAAAAVVPVDADAARVVVEGGVVKFYFATGKADLAVDLSAEVHLADFPLPQGFGLEPQVVADFLAAELTERGTDDIALRLAAAAAAVVALAGCASGDVMSSPVSGRWRAAARNFASNRCVSIARTTSPRFRPAADTVRKSFEAYGTLSGEGSAGRPSLPT
mgnify:CR=1 FL=1